MLKLSLESLFLYCSNDETLNIRTKIIYCTKTINSIGDSSAIINHNDANPALTNAACYVSVLFLMLIILIKTYTINTLVISICEY